MLITLGGYTEGGNSRAASRQPTFITSKTTCALSCTRGPLVPSTPPARVYGDADRRRFRPASFALDGDGDVGLCSRAARGLPKPYASPRASTDTD